MNEEKAMKKYIKAVERRLNLPKEVKVRVMSDFESSIEARREAGKTDEEIYTELGDAKKAASDLNEQMKEYAYQKSPWRFLFAALAVVGGLQLLDQLWGALLYSIAMLMMNPYLNGNEAASVGIIGGADGPTAIFVTSKVGNLLDWLLAAVLLIVGIWGFLRLRKCKQK